MGSAITRGMFTLRLLASMAQCIGRSGFHHDNLIPEEAAEQIRWIAGRAKVELSGGIALENVRAHAETGASFVSSGAITHSAPPSTSVSGWT
jgi:hypothetical protein